MLALLLVNSAKERRAFAQSTVVLSPARSTSPESPREPLSGVTPREPLEGNAAAFCCQATKAPKQFAGAAGEFKLIYNAKFSDFASKHEGVFLFATSCNHMTPWDCAIEFMLNSCVCQCVWKVFALFPASY